jgi:DNA primase
VYVSFLIDNDLKDRVRTAVDIVELLGSYMELRRQGRGYVARCPWHDDQKPSLQVNPERQIWKCWVCDLGGDVFSYVMQREGVSFPEALRMLAERGGISLETEPKSHRGSKSDLDKKSLFDAMAWVVEQFAQCLTKSDEAAEARTYVQSRGLTDESIRRFQIGFAPESWSWLIDRAMSRGLSPEMLESVGVVRRNERGNRYDFFRNRVIFPIRDAQGRAIAVGGRVLPGSANDQAKYINCNETRLYSKSHQLYGLDMARDAISKQRQAIVVEGYTDVIMAHQHGLTNAVAVCGTALGESHIRLLRRYCDSVVLLLDGDEAGQKRTNEILELFVGAQMDLRVMTLPDGLDPCDFLIERGEAEMRKLLAQSVDALEHKIRVACSGFNPLIDTHRANAALEDILRTLSLAPRGNLLSDEASRLRKDQVVMRLARQFGLDDKNLRQRIREMQTEANRRRPGVAEEKTPVTVTLRFAEMSAMERELFEILIDHPELVPAALERFPMTSLNSETAKQLLQLYMELELAGNDLDFASIMSAVEEASVKSLLASLQEEAEKKSAHTTIDAEQRLFGMYERIASFENQAEDQQRLRVLEAKQISAEEELALLNESIKHARSRQGLL